ncbi:DNA/RNA non-specific endonuclease [Actinobacillus delphinicola]|uniref:Endonuclease n=1 Tax=Actinobacillus delphinicola TaxID=51161 RepID=A0A448TS44_9PAST|nr:DNA/RNA non-specific endonuclease [Actinobacillus delphinicola]VEJ08608.1 Nuclease precursor [Actinobacillus delphinicola]
MAKKPKVPQFGRGKKLLLLMIILGAGYFFRNTLNVQSALTETKYQIAGVLEGKSVDISRIFSKLTLRSANEHRNYHGKRPAEHINGSDIGGSCALNLYENKAPVIEIPKMAQESKIICNYAYAGRASFISKSTLYSAEHLTKARILAAQKIERINPFHPDERLTPSERSELADYRGKGYDRGHLAPNADMGDAISQYQSFSLANMMPEVPEHNRKTWAEIEKETRKLALKYNNVYTVTVPVYENVNGQMPSHINTIGKNHVYIPNYIAKAIYIPELE